MNSVTLIRVAGISIDYDFQTDPASSITPVANV